MPFDPFDPRPIAPLLDADGLALAAATAELARAFASRDRPESDEEARREARLLLTELGERGWLRHVVPAAHGGMGERPSLVALCLIREALGFASPLADAVFALQALGSMPIVLSDNEAMKRRWLPDVAAGRAMAAFAMTEPEAGSDVAALATRARRDGPDGDYWIDGWKWLISNAGIADFYCVFAAVEETAGAARGEETTADPSESARARGISCFVVDAHAGGLSFLGAQVMSEPHPLGELSFEACRVPASCRLGEEGKGLKLGLRALDRLRPTVAAAACGMAARALDEARTHARIRRQFGVPLAEQPMVQAKLARMATDLAAARLLTYRAALAGDTEDRRITLEAAQAKLFATEAAQRIVDEAVQILGGRGVLRDSVVDRLYRSVRALRIYEGTSEIQHLVVARQLLRE
jgi:acyl-CoA dehydrogenase